MTATLAPPESTTGTITRSRRHVHATVVRVSCAVIGAHIVVDSFVQPRPGTSARDHLISGTVPVIILAMAVVLVARLRVGGAAIVAGGLGTAVVIGTAGAPVASLVGGRVSLVNVSGLACMIAGLALVVWALRELVRSRNTSGTRVHRWSRRAAKGLLGLLIALFVSTPIGLSYVVANRSNPADANPELGPHESITLLTGDGLTLTGSYVPSTNGAAVILLPGASRARLLADHGYGVLVFEPRGQGSSEGDPNLLGWSLEEDVRAAIRYLQARPDVDPDRIGGLGLSFGGEVMLQTAAHDPALRAVVSEGAGSRWLADDLHRPLNPLQLPFSAMSTLATAVFTDSMPPDPLEDLVADISPRPLLLIWTPKGIGGEWFNPNYYERAGEPKAIWEIPESNHTGGLAARPAEYERRVIEFFDAALHVDEG